MKYSKAPIDRERIRKIRNSFSWVAPRGYPRFITGGFLEKLSPAEILLYFFLVVVGDKNGVSFYHYSRICQLLKIDVQSCLGARKGLIEKSLIAYRNRVPSGCYQVLELPITLVDSRQRVSQPDDAGLRSIKEILKSLGG